METSAPSSTPFRLVVPDLLLAEVVNHARGDLPNECCGFLVGIRDGDIGRVSARIPLQNAAASPVLYDVEPRELFSVERLLRQRGWEVLAVYHSHPTSPAIPSRTDRERRYGESVVCVIVSMLGETPEVRGWWLTAESHREAAIEVAEGEAID